VTEQCTAHDIVTVHSTYVMPLPKNLKITDNHKGLSLYELFRWVFPCPLQKCRRAGRKKKVLLVCHFKQTIASHRDL